MTEETGVRVERIGAVGKIVLDRPSKGNAVDIPTARALMEAVIELEEDAAVRCILLTGEGRLFCAGGDVAAFGAAGDRLPAFIKEITVYVHAAVARLMQASKPVVTAVNGPAAGAGVGLALLGDIVLVAPSAHFTLAYPGIGLSPDAGASWMLPRLVGLRRAQEISLTNRRVGAEEAAAIGMITRVVEAEALQEEALTTATTLAGGATQALGVLRRQLLEGTTATLETQLDRESRDIARLSGSPDGREGVASFLERRPPVFSGKP